MKSLIFIILILLISTNSYSFPVIGDPNYCLEKVKSGSLCKLNEGDCDGAFECEKGLRCSYDDTLKYDICTPAPNDNFISSEIDYCFNGGINTILTATPSVGYKFKQWGGACSGTEPTCTLQITANTTVEAIFENPQSDDGFFEQCDYDINIGDIITLTATPCPGYKFVRWEGNTCTGTEPTCNIQVTDDMVIDAIFEAINQSTDKQCEYDISNLNSITLTATPSPGYSFKYWIGNVCSGSDPICTIQNASGNITVHAVFGSSTNTQ